MTTTVEVTDAATFKAITGNKNCPGRWCVTLREGDNPANWVGQWFDGRQAAEDAAAALARTHSCEVIRP